jgi:hypothetical protein
VSMPSPPLSVSVPPRPAKVLPYQQVGDLVADERVVETRAAHVLDRAQRVLVAAAVGAVEPEGDHDRGGIPLITCGVGAGAAVDEVAAVAASITLSPSLPISVSRNAEPCRFSIPRSVSVDTIGPPGPEVSSVVPSAPLRPSGPRPSSSTPARHIPF